MFDNMEDKSEKGEDSKVRKAEALIDEAKGLLEEAGENPSEYIADYVGGEEEGEEESEEEGMDESKKSVAVAMLRKKVGSMKGDE